MVKVCEQCSVEFKASNRRQKTCSFACAERFLPLKERGSLRFRQKRKCRICVFCGKCTDDLPRRRKSCSKRCEYEYKRLKYSKKMSDIFLAYYETERGKERIFSMLGANNLNWRGGVTSKQGKLRNKYGRRLKVWSRLVKERDNYVCALCGRNESSRSHHVLPFADYPQYRFDVDNGVTLCAACHRRLEYYLSRGDSLWLFINLWLGWRIVGKRLVA